jgi:ABC-type polar amino acid transport system ATPase subunit
MIKEVLNVMIELAREGMTMVCVSDETLTRAQPLARCGALNGGNE